MEIKHGRGRPRKETSTIPFISISKEEVKRKPGRPKKEQKDSPGNQASKYKLNSQSKKLEPIIEPLSDSNTKWTILMQGYSQRAYELAKPNLRKVALLCATTKSPFLVIKNEINKEIKVHVFDRHGEYLNSAFVESEEEARKYALKLIQ